MSNGRTMVRLKTTLLGGAAAMTLGTTAFAQTTIDSPLTTPQVVGTGSLVITDAGSIAIDSGTALTVAGDGEVDIQGPITVNDGTANDAGGVLIDNGGGATTFTNFTQTSNILLASDETVGDDEVPPETFGADRFGFRLAAGSYDGSISFSNTVVIDLDGDSSIAQLYEGDLTGDITTSADIAMRGAGATGILINGDLDGNFDLGSAGNVSVTGVDSGGIVINGDVTGSVRIGGEVRVTGFEDLSPETDGADGENNAAQAALTSGDGVTINGDVGGGILIDGPLPSEFDFAVENDDDPDNDSEAITTAAEIQVLGGGTALIIEGATVGAPANVDDIEVDPGLDINPGSELVYDNPLTTGTVDPFGFVNRGIIDGQGIYDGIDANGASIANSTIANGIRNDGIFQAIAGEGGDATALSLGAGLSTPLLLNDGSIRASSSGTDGNATALSIASGAEVMSIINSGVIEATLTSDNGNAIAIQSGSSDLVSIENTGIISTTLRDDSAVEGAATGQAIALDFSTVDAGVTINNTVPEATFSGGNRSGFGIVIGDVLTGDGNDTYRADAGSTDGNLALGGGNDSVLLSQGANITGDIDFGTGNNILDLDGANVTGALTFDGGNSTVTLADGATFQGFVETLNSGSFDLDVQGGAFLLSTRTDTGGSFENSVITVGDLTVSGGEAPGALGFTVAPIVDTEGNTDLQISRINATGDVSLEDGTEIRTLFTKAFDGTEFTDVIITSGGTLNADTDALVFNVDGSSPFLFEQTVSLDETTQELSLTLTRRTPEALGLTPAFEDALDPLVSALTQDDDLGILLFNATTQDEFLGVFKEFMPGPLDAPIAYVRAQNNSMTTIVSHRTEALRRDGALPRTAWLQQQGYFINRGEDESSNGFDGGGFVLAVGADTPLGPIDVVGGALHFASARYDEQLGDDFPFNRVTYGVDFYAAERLGKVLLDGRVGYGFSQSDSERNIDVGDERRTLTGEWDGTQITANARVRYEQPTIRDFKLTPFASVDFVSLSEDGYSEEGDQVVALTVEDRDAESLRANAGLTISKDYELRPSAYDTGIPGTLTPQLSLGWSQELITDDLEATYHFGPADSGADTFTLLAEPEDGAAFIGADINYQNQYAKVQVGVSGQFSDTTDVLALRASVGLKW